MGAAVYLSFTRSPHPGYRYGKCLYGLLCYTSKKVLKAR